MRDLPPAPPGRAAAAPAAALRLPRRAPDARRLVVPHRAGAGRALRLTRRHAQPRIAMPMRDSRVRAPHRPRQEPVVAGPRRRLQRLPRRGRRATRLLIDCGNGVFAKLRRHAATSASTRCVLSHLHADHMLDLVPFAYALTYGPRLRGTAPALHVPPGRQGGAERLCGTWGSPTLIEDAFDLQRVRPVGRARAGRGAPSLPLVPHYVPYATRSSLRASGPRGGSCSAPTAPERRARRAARGRPTCCSSSRRCSPTPTRPIARAPQRGAGGRSARRAGSPRRAHALLRPARSPGAPGAGRASVRRPGRARRRGRELHDLSAPRFTKNAHICGQVLRL